MDTEDESIAERVGRRRRIRTEVREELEDKLIGETINFGTEEEESLNEDNEDVSTTMSDTAAAAEASRLAEVTRMKTDRDNAVITDPDFITAIESVMNLRIDSQIPQALFDSGFQDWEDLEHLDHSQVETLMWWPPHKDRRTTTEAEKPTNLNGLACLRQFIRYMDTKRDNSDDWSDIDNFDKTEFKAFRRTPQGREAVIASAPVTSKDKEQVLKEWLKRKRNPSDYEILNKDSQYPQWLIKFHATIQTHHVADVLDENFNPKNIIDTSDQQLWKEKQVFMWAVFTRVLQTNMGQYIIKRNLKDKDAREVWFALKRHYTDSDAKAIVADTIWKEINKMDFSEASGSREAYCTKFFEKVRNYNDLADDTELLSIGQQAIALKHAFIQDDSMKATYSAMAVQATATGNKMTGTKLFEFIMSQAKLHDAEDDSSTPKTKSNKFKVLMTQQCPDMSEEQIDLFLSTNNQQEYKANRTTRTYSTHQSHQEYEDYSVDSLVEQGYTQPLEGTGEMICTQTDCRNEDDISREIDIYHTNLLRINFNNTGRSPTGRSNGAGRSNYGGRGRGNSDRPGHKFTSGSVPKWLWDKMTPEEKKHWYGLESGTRIQLRTATQDSTSPPDEDTYVIKQHRIINASAAKQNLTTRKIPIRSTISPASASRLLSDKPRSVKFEDDGSYAGYLTPGIGCKTRKADFHCWYDQEILEETQDNAIYNVDKAKSSKIKHGCSLADRGANGGVAGAGMRWIEGPEPPRHVHIAGVDAHQINNIKVGTCGAVLFPLNSKPVIGIFNEYAFTGRNQTIHSCIQLEDYGATVDDKAIAFEGTQRITTLEGYVFPLSIQAGLPYLEQRPYTDQEWETLDHVIMTSDQEWNPMIADSTFDESKGLIDTPFVSDLLPRGNTYNVRGELMDIAVNSHIACVDDRFNIMNDTSSISNNNGCVSFDQSETMDIMQNAIQQPMETDKSDNGCIEHLYTAPEFPPINDFFDAATLRCVTNAFRNKVAYGIFETSIDPDIAIVLKNGLPRTHKPSDIDYEAFQPYFAFLPIDIIKLTFNNTTQYGRMPASTRLQRRYKSPSPAMNAFRLNDDVMTDAIFSETPSVDGGQTSAQVFFGALSRIGAAYLMRSPIGKTKSTVGFLAALQDFVCQWGCPKRLLSDHAGNQSSTSVRNYLRDMYIPWWQTEAHKQHQNGCERRWQTVKSLTNRLMDRTDADANTWFFALTYVIFILNLTCDPNLGNRNPYFLATGQVGDISPIIQFFFNEPIYYKKIDNSFGDTEELMGNFMGIAENYGHAMTFHILTSDTQKIIQRAEIRTALDPKTRNLRANPLVDDGKPFKEFIKGPDNGNFGIPGQTYGEELDGRPKGVKKWMPPTMSPNQEQVSPGILAEASPDPIEESPIIAPNKNRTGPVINPMNPIGKPHTKANGQPIDISDSFYDSLGLGSTYDDNKKTGERNEKEARFDPVSIKGRTFISTPDDLGNTKRLQVLDTIHEEDAIAKQDPTLVKFKVLCKEDQFEDIMTYNEVMNMIEEQEDSDTLWHFNKIIGHRKDKGKPAEIKILWTGGTTSHEPVSEFIRGSTENKFLVAKYAQEQGLLNITGWKQFRGMAKRKTLIARTIKQAKMRSYRLSQKYQFGYKIPRDYDEALEFDMENGNNKWAHATFLEMQMMDLYQVFTDKGLFSPDKIPNSFKKIGVHLIYAVKHDGRFKARLVADGHLTDIPLTSVYAGVVSLRGLRMVLFLSELNGIPAWQTDVGNAYLEAKTTEKVCIRAGPEFGKEKEGHLLIIYKALYGLKSSGLAFKLVLDKALRSLGFKPSLCEPEIYMRKNHKLQLWEYVATYVDDLACVIEDVKKFLDALQSKPIGFKLKGSQLIEYHLGCGFTRDKYGVLCQDPQKYIEKLREDFIRWFGKAPSTKIKSPLEKGDHPELDTSEFLETEDIEKYQSMIGSLQWLISIGRWDMLTHVMTMSSFRSAPRSGHLKRVMRIYEYACNFKHFKLRYRTEEPDLSSFDNKDAKDWTHTPYGKQYEELPTDAPEPLGKRVTLSHYFDANLMHDVLSGKSVTGCIHFWNKTSMDWFSKKQKTPETATYGSEYCSGKTCFEQIVDHRMSARYLGVPLNVKSYAFGDNESMIDSSNVPHSKLHARHNILNYHYVRSMMAAGYVILTHIPSADNISDVLSKHWGHGEVYNGILKPIFHHEGNTATLYENDDPLCLDERIQEKKINDG